MLPSPPPTVHGKDLSHNQRKYKKKYKKIEDLPQQVFSLDALTRHYWLLSIRDLDLDSGYNILKNNYLGDPEY